MMCGLKLCVASCGAIRDCTLHRCGLSLKLRRAGGEFIKSCFAGEAWVDVEDSGLAGTTILVHFMGVTSRKIILAI